jgi:integrase
MKWENFTAGRVAGFKCDASKKQSIFWDGKTPGLGLRVTAAGSKSYIFETTIKGKTLRITIGDVSTYTIDAAQKIAKAYRAQTDKGIDPRQVEADRLTEEQAARDAGQAEAAATQAQQVRELVTLGDVWPEYMAERAPQWGERTLFDHEWMIHAGGEKRTRSPKLTIPGPLASLALVRLVDLTPERVEVWAKVEAKTRATRARLALRLLKACLNWCAAHSAYAEVTKSNAAKSAKARESLGKAKVKSDVLQREQLAAWFAGVRKIGNPIISAYLQTLLITGARREEVAGLRWADVDFQWNSIKMGDKVEDFRMVPLTPYVAHLLAALPRRNDFVFSSPTAASGRLAEPRIAHNEAVAAAGLPLMTLHGLRRSFATLCEWTETPAGIAAQIQGHAPQGVREQNYIRRPLDLLRMWHVKIEGWMLEQAAIDFVPVAPGLRVVAAA